MNIITINFVECDPQPSKGYHLYWRKAGSGDPYTDGGNFFTSPIVFSDDFNPAGADYEGILVSEYSNQSCNEMPWTTIIEISSGGSPGSFPDTLIQCLLGLLNPYTGTLNVVKDITTGAIGISGTIQCITCPCMLNTGSVVGRTTPSSPCKPCDDATDFSNSWVFGETGYLVYIGAPVEIPCGGLVIDINFMDPCAP